MDRGNRRGGGDTPRGYSSGSNDDSETRASAITDPLTSVDDILRETNQKLDELNTQLSRQAPAQPTTQPTGGAGGGSGLIPVDEPPIYPYDYSRVVEQDTFKSDPATETFVAPYDGTVRRVVLGWPLGSQQAVGIGLTGPSQAAIIPRGPADAEYLAFDDKVLTFNLNESLEDDDEITIRFVNNDSQDHFVNVDIFFQEDDD